MMRTTGWTILAMTALLLAAPPGRAGEGPAAEKVRAIDARLAKLPDLAHEPQGPNAPHYAAYMAAYEAVGETLRLLRGDDAAWAYARPKLVALLDGADTDSVRAGLLKIVLFDSGNGGPRAAARTLAAHPEAFDTNLLVKAYERGVEAAAPLLEKRCHYDPDRMIDVAPAASLALQGNEAGRRVLEAVFETPILVRTRPDTWFAAAIGLRALGEKDAWTRAAAAAETEVRQRLDGGDVRAAASYVLTMEYYHGAILHDHAVSLAFMCRPADRHVQEHLDDLTTGEAVWARFREVQH